MKIIKLATSLAFLLIVMGCLSRDEKKERETYLSSLDTFVIKANEKEYVCKGYDIKQIKKSESEGDVLLGIGANWSKSESETRFVITTYNSARYDFRKKVLSEFICVDYEISKQE